MGIRENQNKQKNDEYLAFRIHRIILIFAWENITYFFWLAGKKSSSIYKNVMNFLLLWQPFQIT